jgi:isopentenyldiphosphate isomerase
MMAEEEFFPLVDEAGNIVGRATRKECHGGSMMLHPVVHLHIFNAKGELYLQKRSMNKDIQPGKWDTAVGGHVDFGEGVELALRREAREELGVVDFKPEFNYSYLWESTVERELVYSYRTVYEGKITIDPVELDEGRFWSFEEIEKSLSEDLFTGNFKKEFEMLKEVKR